MNTPDEFIQKQIEEGNNAFGQEAEAYKVVFGALKREPSFKLSPDFAQKISAQVVAKKSFNWDRFLLMAASIGFVAALIYAFASVSTSFSVGVFTFISGYSGLFIFGIAFILLLNWLDKKIIRHSMPEKS